MSKMESKPFTTLVGRLVGGSVHEKITEDFDGRPLLIKTGNDKGQPTQLYSFSVAFPKIPGKHWSESSDLGRLVWETGHAQMGPLAQRPDFAWKVTDGDSAVPNKKNRKPCEKEGYPGHWVFNFSSSFPPSTYNADGSAPVPAESIKKGFFVQVAGSVVGNGNDSNPGVYLNHNMVALSAYGPEIKTGADPKAAGFGKGVTLPPGASATPPAGMAPTGSAPSAPAAPLPPPPAPAAAPLPPPVAVQPAPSFIAPPVAPPPPPAAPAAPARVWRGPAGTTYEQYAAAGWNDAQMQANGLLG